VFTRRMRDNREHVPVIAETLKVSRATLYRYLAEVSQVYVTRTRSIRPSKEKGALS
jgi:Helix-turn-helix domain of resolvase